MAKGQTGSNAVFTGTSLSLNYWRDKVYAFSGEVNPNQSTVTALEFSTSKEMIDARIMWGIDLSEITDDKFAALTIKFNGVLVYALKGQDRLPYTGMVENYTIDLYIPPLTTVKIEVSTDENNDVGNTVMLKGKVLV